MVKKAQKRKNDLLFSKWIDDLKCERGKKRRGRFYNIGRYSYALSPELIKPGTLIGSFCSLAEGVRIGPGYHPVHFLTTSPFSYHLKRENEANVFIRNETDRLTNDKTNIIGNDVWIGVNAIILEGIHIGDGAVIGANAVVTHDVPPYAIVGGVPAKLIRYRFEEDCIKEIQRSRWWTLPDHMISDLPLNDIKRSLEIIEERKKMVSEKEKICFIVTSCIYPTKRSLSYSDIRSIFTEQERLDQTKGSIISIREKCPNADIILVDNGVRDPKADLLHMVDGFYYVGDRFIYKLGSSSPNKSLGEILMLLYATKIDLSQYDIIFKLSGRYCLNDDFFLCQYDKNMFNFLNYKNGKRFISHHNCNSGSYSTRLYSCPGDKIKQYRKALWKCLFWGLTGKSIETSLPRTLKNEDVFYHEKLGVSGMIAIDRSWIVE